MDSQDISSWFSFDCTSAVSLTLHFIHNQFSHLHISLHSFTSYRNLPMGPPPSTSSPHNLCPHRPSHLALGHPFLYLYTHPKLFFIHLVIVKAFVSNIYIAFFITLGDLLFPGKATHVALGWGTHYLLLSLTSFINPEYPTVHVPLISDFVHFVTPLAQFNPRLVIPLTLDPVSWLLPLILHIYPQPRVVLSLTAS
jgi:hypothetical protein